MKVHKAEDFIKGWFIGNFKPSLLKTSEFEAAVKFYVKGDREDAHVHRVAREYTVIGSGRFEMNGQILQKGDIVEIPPGEAADFHCMEDGVTFVVKAPSVAGDKHRVEK